MLRHRKAHLISCEVFGRFLIDGSAAIISETNEIDLFQSSVQEKCVVSFIDISWSLIKNTKA